MYQYCFTNINLFRLISVQFFFKYRSFIFNFSNKCKQKIYIFSSRAIYQLLEPLLRGLEPLVGGGSLYWGAGTSPGI
jgi:hypothetical protein